MAYIGKNPYTDAYTKAETDAKIVELSPPTKLSIGKSAKLSGSASVSNTTLMAGMSTTLYTGNGTTQSINAGVDLATQWGDTANETYGGLVWIKDRDTTGWHRFNDTVRGEGNTIWTNSTGAEAYSALEVTSFNNNGFTGGSNINTSGSDFASWIFQTTHRIAGTTNHGKAYTCHYNPITGFTIVKYEGSGIAGHEIPHHLGRKLGFVTVKNTSYASGSNWQCSTGNGNILQLNTTIAQTNTPAEIQDFSLDTVILGTNYSSNQSGEQLILYGWANSYYDADNVLNGNYYTYVEQDGSGNQVLHLTVHSSTSRDEINWEMNKLINTTSDWNIIDYERGNTKELNANLSNAESTVTANTLINKASPSQFNMPSETSNLNISNAVISITNGINSNGVVNTIQDLGSFTFTPSNGWTV